MDTADGFVKTLSQICDITLTNDFWAVSLPNDLATSSPRSPSLFAYHAALVLLDARALFSKIKVADLLDPSMHANRAAVERHHLFPKGFLSKQGITASAKPTRSPTTHWWSGATIQTSPTKHRWITCPK